jgi:hypothetical protein
MHKLKYVKLCIQFIHCIPYKIKIISFAAQKHIAATNTAAVDTQSKN